MASTRKKSVHLSYACTLRLLRENLMRLTIVAYQFDKIPLPAAHGDGHGMDKNRARL